VHEVEGCGEYFFEDGEEVFALFDFVNWFLTKQIP
jgi:hypothetical protein